LCQFEPAHPLVADFESVAICGLTVSLHQPALVNVSSASSEPGRAKDAASGDG
jgi:hypothetical protein